MTPGKKPFWETTEDIDIALCAEAIVSTFRFLPEDDYLPLFSVCVEPERSEAVKTCALRACLTLVQEVRTSLLSVVLITQHTTGSSFSLAKVT